MHDRLDSRRGDEAWLRDRLADDSTRILVVREGELAEDRGLPVDVKIVDAPILIGRDASNATVVALEGNRNAAVASKFDKWQDARLALLEADEPSIVLHALGMTAWQARTKFCSRCGGPIEFVDGGHHARCKDCGDLQFPRLEPAVIVRITDADDRILLARQSVWPEGRFSVLAGFVEPGETVEDTARREVAEEVGVQIGNLTYVASQPWPFPASLMLAFAAEAETTDIVLEDDEIAEAAWYTRDELVAAMQSEDVLVPPAMSIASQLITDWLGDRRPRTWLEATRDGGDGGRR